MKKGMEQGMKKGMEQGMKKGMEQGMKKGMEQGMEKGMEKGLKRGIEQGASDERKKNAKAMKTLGVPLETIGKITGMAIGDIEKL
jgi:flagellar biosynthesis/type III secretory pathway protein FliH